MNKIESINVLRSALNGRRRDLEGINSEIDRRVLQKGSLETIIHDLETSIKILENTQLNLKT